MNVFASEILLVRVRRVEATITSMGTIILAQ